MASHNCPSCGFNHPSEGGEVPAIVVSGAAQMTLPELENYLRANVEKFGLKLGDSVERVLQALKGEAERGEQAPVPTLSKCPLCPFTSDNGEEFNGHMRDHQNGAQAQPGEPAPVGDMSPELRAALGL